MQLQQQHASLCGATPKTDLGGVARDGLAIGINWHNHWGAIVVGHALTGASAQLGSQGS